MAAHHMLGVSAGQMVIALDPTTDSRFMTDIAVAQLRRHVEALSASEGRGEDAKIAIREILRCAQIYADVIDPQGPQIQSAALALPAPPAAVQRKADVVHDGASDVNSQSLVLRQKEAVQVVAKNVAVEEQERSSVTDSALAAAEEQSGLIEEETAVEGDSQDARVVTEEPQDDNRQEHAEEKVQGSEQKDAQSEEFSVKATPAQSCASPEQTLHAYPQYNQPYYTQSGLFVPPQQQSLYIPPQPPRTFVPSQSHDLVQWSDVTDIPYYGGTSYTDFPQQYQDSPYSSAAHPFHMPVSTATFTPGAAAFTPGASVFVPGANGFVPSSSAPTDNSTERTSSKDHALEEITVPSRQKDSPSAVGKHMPIVEEEVAQETTSESAPTPQTDPVDRTDSPLTGNEPHIGRRKAKRLHELQKAASRAASPAKIESTSIGEFILESPTSSPMISGAPSVVDGMATGSSTGEVFYQPPGDEQGSDEWKAPVTRFTPSVRELEVVVWVPREERDPPAANLEPVDKTAWFNAQYETITNVKAHKAYVTDLGHILALFPTAEDRDEFKANASQWLKSGRTIIDEFFDIEATIEDINTYRYLAAKLVNPAGRQAVVNRIMRQNFATIPDAQILRVEWATGKQHRPLEPKKFVKDSIIITFDNAMDANAILEHNLMLKEDSLLTFIYRTQLPILQCNNCGRFGHHEACCWYDMRCLKCTGPHAATTCRRRPESWKCVLCYESHHSKDSVCSVRKQEKELMESTRPPLGHFHQTPNSMEENDRRRAAEHVPRWQASDSSTASDEYKLGRPLNEKPRLVQMVEDWQGHERREAAGEESEASAKMNEGGDEGEAEEDEIKEKEVEDVGDVDEEAVQSAPGPVEFELPQQYDGPVANGGSQNVLAHLQTKEEPGNNSPESEASSSSASEGKDDHPGKNTGDVSLEPHKPVEKDSAETPSSISVALAGAPENTAQSSNAIIEPTDTALETGKSYPVVMGAVMLAPTPVKQAQSAILEKPSVPPSAPTIPKAMKRDAARVDSPIGNVSATVHKKQKLSSSSTSQLSSPRSAESSAESDKNTLIDPTSPAQDVADVSAKAKQTYQEPDTAKQTPTKPVFTPIVTEVLKRTIISKSTPSPKPVVVSASAKAEPLPTRYTSTVEELQLYVSLPGHERQNLTSGTDKTEWLNAVIAGHTTMKAVQAVVTGLQHLLVTFDSAEDRDDFIKDGKKWLKGGRKVMDGTYDVQLTINETNVMKYLSSELPKQSGRGLVRQIMLENQGIIPNATILRMGWNPKKGPRPSGAGDIKNLKPADQPAIFVTFGTAEDANAALDKGLTILGKKSAVTKYLHKYNILQCLNCGALGHHMARCWAETLCLKCGKPHHTDSCVNPAKLKCALCEKAHDSRINDCKIRQQEQNFVRTGLLQNLITARY